MDINYKKYYICPQCGKRKFSSPETGDNDENEGGQADVYDALDDVAVVEESAVAEVAIVEDDVVSDDRLIVEALVEADKELKYSIEQVEADLKKLDREITGHFAKIFDKTDNSFKNIDLNGRIVGNITCNNAEMHESQIQGNVRMKGSVEMERDTLLIGDIVSTYAKVNGKVKGNLDVAGKAELKSDAVVFGDISASTLTVDDGAIIQGYVSTTFLNKEESRNIFPDVINISD